MLVVFDFVDVLFVDIFVDIVNVFNNSVAHSTCSVRDAIANCILVSLLLSRCNNEWNISGTSGKSDIMNPNWERHFVVVAFVYW